MKRTKKKTSDRKVPPLVSSSPLRSLLSSSFLRASNRPLCVLCAASVRSVSETPRLSHLSSRPAAEDRGTDDAGVVAELGGDDLDRLARDWQRLALGDRTDEVNQLGDCLDHATAEDD